ncbi:MAG: L-threonylcarbamoyladenylate synthase [Patescibacteria group bacterium]|nr:L-threonylcarbamoyladenylate synthase [Patescibacteria group bacterium]
MRTARPENLSEIAEALKQGATVVFPTETSYGLGGDATDQTAVDKIFQIKDRPKDRPVLIVVPDVATARKYLVWNDALENLARTYWPGALTVVGQYRGGDLAPGVVAPDNTVAVRVTADPWLKELTQKSGRPLVATSANLSGQSEIYDARQVAVEFSGREFTPDLLVDADVLPVSPPSTIVSVVDDKIKILRQGAIKIDAEKVKRSGSVFFGAIIVGAVAILSAMAILYFWRVALIDIENNTWLTGYQRKNPFFSGEKNPLVRVKGLYLTAYSAGSPAKMEEIINLIKKTELNAVVIDIKDYSGLVLFDSHLPTVVQLKLKDDRLGDLRALVEKLHKNRIYVIARQTVFQDPVLAEAKPEWAIKNKNGGVWRDNKGLSWVDPTRREVWQYNLSIAREALRYGFDEINFDYVRFPSDGAMSQVVYTVGDKKKYQVMRDFYNFMNRGLADLPVWLSLDMFGFVMEKSGEDDMNIGQRLADAVGNADYICPMMYPSHYPSGHLGLGNPAEYPAIVIANGMKTGLPQFAGARAKVRPWLQAFNLGAVYDAAKIRAQIEVVEQYSDAGWLLWNASNRYTEAGLR